MRIQNISSVLQDNSSNNRYNQDNLTKRNVANANVTKNSNIAFKGWIPTLMSKIENMGFLGSFLVQDGIGMTAPRSITGFNRDRDITGEYNIQEGFEVLLREGLTGPLIIMMPILVLGLARKLCKSTFSNTNLIKRLTENFKDMIGSDNFDKNLISDSSKKDELRKVFVRYNIENAYRNTVPMDENPTSIIDELCQKFEKVNGDVNILKRKNPNKEVKSEITSMINSKIIENSNECNKFDRVILGNGDHKKTYMTTDFLQALYDYADDVITKNNKSTELSKESLENIKNSLATKRLGTNILNVIAVLGGLYVLPKVYARGNAAPSAKAMEISKQKYEHLHVEDNNDQEGKEVSFKGNKPTNNSILAKLGKLVTKIPEKISTYFEYNGFNFTPALFAGLSLFGLLFPRGKKAYERAPIDENGKKDYTEIYEILTRDTISSLSVVFTAPILTKAIVNKYEKNKGFVLTNKPIGQKSIKDILYPFSDLRVFSGTELDAMYGKNLSTNKNMINFCEYIDKQGGDISKIIELSENKEQLFNEKTFTLDSIKESTVKEKNAKLIDFFKNIKDNAKRLGIENPELKENQDKLVKTLMADSKQVLSKVKGLISVPAFISTFIISPAILGVFLPKLTYAITRSIHEKKLKKEDSVNT